jgi:hypothetical protein
MIQSARTERVSLFFLPSLPLGTCLLRRKATLRCSACKWISTHSHGLLEQHPCIHSLGLSTFSTSLACRCARLFASRDLFSPLGVGTWRLFDHVALNWRLNRANPCRSSFRARSPVSARVCCLHHHSSLAAHAEPITGQVVALYHGNECLGGGIVA